MGMALQRYQSSLRYISVMECIVLTGYSRGLGAEVARLLRLSGDTTYIVYLGRKKPNEELSSLSMFVEADLSRPLDTAVFDVMKSLPISRMSFISNAGSIEPISPINRLTSRDIEASMFVNSISPMVIASRLSHICSEQGIQFRVLNITSGAAQRPVRGWGAYCSGKAGAKMFFDVMAEETSHDVIQYDPGVVDTQMQQIIRTAQKEDMPDVELFRGFLPDNKLRRGGDVAKEMLDLLGI